MDPVIAEILRLALALLFAAAALHKLRDLARFSSAVEQYGIVPSFLVVRSARALVVSECTLVALLVLPPTRELGALGAVALLLLYSTAIALNLVRGRRDIDCGCWGAAVGRRTLGPGLLFRNGVLLFAALQSLLPIAPRPLTWLDYTSIAFALVTLALAWSAAGQLATTAPALLRRRMST